MKGEFGKGEESDRFVVEWWEGCREGCGGFGDIRGKYESLE